MRTATIPGIDHFLEMKKYKSMKLGLVTNDVAQTSTGIRTRTALLENGFDIRILFSPEHGINAAGIDGSFQENIVDPVTGLKVVSLYGDHLSLTEEDLHDIDCVLFDIPDVGCRFYTYLWTMTYVMEACAAFQKTMVILDRPNPISGDLDLAEGPMLEEACSAFIGRWNIPVRHSCTFGELAQYFKATRVKDIDLQIVKATEWNREEMIRVQDFVPTSPAIHDINTALLYPGMGLLEGINVNEGRGTGLAFTICGAPWIKSEELINKFSEKEIAGVETEAISFIPVEGPHKGAQCNGIVFRIINRKIFHPVRSGFSLLESIVELYPQFVEERLYPTRANPSGIGHLDKLTGIGGSFAKIKKRQPFDLDTAAWKKLIIPFLLY